MIFFFRVNCGLKLFSKELRELLYKACPSRGLVLFLPGAGSCCCPNIVNLIWAWGLGVAQAWHLHAMLRWRQVSGYDISFFYFAANWELWGRGAFSPWSTSKGTDFCVLLCSVCSLLRFCFSALLALVEWKISMLPFAVCSPWPYHLGPADVAHWKPRPQSASLAPILSHLKGEAVLLVPSRTTVHFLIYL